MAHNATPIGAMVQFDPQAAKAQIAASYQASGGNWQKVAGSLGVTYRTLCRWRTLLGMTEVSYEKPDEVTPMTGVSDGNPGETGPGMTAVSGSGEPTV